VSDALLWRGALGWGDRTPAFLAARADLPGEEPHSDEAAGQDVAFVYFQAALDRPPARVEFPRWILDAGLLDQVMDAVRAETIVGNGYPYPIEAADAVAVITTEDHARFYRLFQEFAEREGLAFGFSRKALSKSRRRV
jgi:NurA domain-containing protein